MNNLAHLDDVAADAIPVITACSACAGDYEDPDRTACGGKTISTIPLQNLNGGTPVAMAKRGISYANSK